MLLFLAALPISRVDALFFNLTAPNLNVKVQKAGESNGTQVFDWKPAPTPKHVEDQLSGDEAAVAKKGLTGPKTAEPALQERSSPEGKTDEGVAGHDQQKRGEHVETCAEIKDFPACSERKCEWFADVTECRDPFAKNEKTVQLASVRMVVSAAAKEFFSSVKKVLSRSGSATDGEPQISELAAWILLGLTALIVIIVCFLYTCDKLSMPFSSQAVPALKKHRYSVGGTKPRRHRRADIAIDRPVPGSGATYAAAAAAVAAGRMERPVPPPRQSTWVSTDIHNSRFTVPVLSTQAHT